jgi:transcriptional regulator with XRE-family HTH domain
LSSSLAFEQKDRSRWTTALALALLNERRRKKLSQAEVSQRVGLARTYISRIETGRIGISFAILAQYVKALGLSVTEIVSRAELMLATDRPVLRRSVSRSVSTQQRILDRQTR